MIKSSFYTSTGEKWECVGSILWSGKRGEEPWKREEGISCHVKKGYGRVDSPPKEKTGVNVVGRHWRRAVEHGPDQENRL